MNSALPRSPTVDIAPDIAAQAVDWLFELQEAGDAEAPRRAFADWLAAHPEHRRAWDHIQRVNGRLQQVAEHAPPVRQALLGGPRRQRRELLIALLTAGASGGLWLNSASGRQSTGWLADLRTGVGERRTLNLADGSELSLNSDSAVDLQFDATRRQLTLQRGEILIRTGHDAQARPFLVRTPYGVLRPLGTRFAVRLLADAGQLAVFEGAVAIQTGDDTATRQVLHAGEQSRFAPGLAVVPRAADENAVAWREGMLVASGMPLAGFLAELSRHRYGRLACAPEIAHLQVSGSYPLADTERILDALCASLPVRIDALTRYWVTLRPAA
ncbi:FecR domain-containing protein [Uliginosibacterium sediminicola]|uniref:FecR domain-containing protein n=1 Tax=Uliginosibacterium sediminicola TaxID=2024550 RepID=A0ABU9YVL2_9RHOO